MVSSDSSASFRYNSIVIKPALVVIGLGNIGKTYENTRHNVGFLAAEHAAKQLKSEHWGDQQKFQCFTAEAELKEKSVLFAKPTTYMNLSGHAIKKIVDFYKLNPANQILVCCDDVDLPLGTHRFRMSGGPGTHNGLKSIVEVFGENFPRLRIGLGRQPEGADLAAWVLSRLSGEEQKQLQPAFASVVDCMQSTLTAQV